MISDSDKLYEELDKWHDDNEYDKIANAVMNIPHENWSNKMWFRLISAYNNLKATPHNGEKSAATNNRTSTVHSFA